MLEAREMLLCCCLLILTLVIPACAKDLEVRARGATAVSVGVGNR